MDIIQIPQEVVVDFINKYYPDLVDNEYDILEDLISTGNIESAPDEIVNWIIAYNHRDDKNIKIIKKSDILLKKLDLTELYQFFGVEKKSDLIQILSYLGKLNDDSNIFDDLPSEILNNILINLDIDSLLLWFKTSKNINIYGNNQLNKILRAKIALYSDMDTRDLNTKQLIVFTKIIEKDRYYLGRINNKFRVFDRNSELDYLSVLFKKFQSNKEANNILKDRIALHLDMNIIDPTNQQIIMLDKITKAGRYHGVIKDGKLTIFDRYSDINKFIFNDDRRSNTGKTCNFLKKSELIEILLNLVNDQQNSITFDYLIRLKTSYLCETIKDRMIQLGIVEFL